MLASLILKRLDVNTLLPPHLESKTQVRNHIATFADGAGYLIGTYQDVGSFVVYSFASKKQIRVNRSVPLKAIRTNLPWIASVHEDPKDKSGSVELYDVEHQRSATIYRWKDPKDAIITVFPGQDQIFALAKKAFLRFTYKLEKQEPVKVGLIGEEVQQPIVKLSLVLGGHIVLGNLRHIQIWDLMTGTMLVEAKPKDTNSTFLMIQFDGNTFATCTIQDLYIWQKGKPACTVISQKVAPCALTLEGDQLFVGNLEGSISVFSATTSKPLYDVNKVDGDAKTKSLISQMKTKVNLMKVVDTDMLLVSTETGEVHVYFKDVKEQSEPAKVIPVHGKVSFIGRSTKHLMMFMHKPDKKADELLLVPNRFLKNMKVFRNMGRKFSSSQTAAEIDEDQFEIVKTGMLASKVETRDASKERPKKRYCVLRSNGFIYMYKSATDATPQETFVLKSKSLVKVNKHKRTQFTVQLSMGNNVLKFAADDDSEAESWIDAISTTLREMSLQDVFQLDYGDIHFDKAPNGDQVVLGTGSFSTVAKATFGNKPVAVKIFKSASFVNSEEFRNEILVLNAVKHPNILPIIGVSKPPNVTLVTPFIANGTLFDFLHRSKSLAPGQYTWNVFLRFAIDIATALHYLHNFRMNGIKAPIIHADLKTANILVNNVNFQLPMPSIQLIDFGLSMHKASSMEEAKRQGTVAYMAPEMLQGEGKYTPKVDVYSYGLLLWELATKSIPYAKSSSKTIENIVVGGQRLPIPGYLPQVLIDLIQGCWNPNPSERPSFSEILTKLNNLAAYLLANVSYHDPVLSDDNVSPRSRSNSHASSLHRSDGAKIYGRRKELIKVVKLVNDLNMFHPGMLLIHGNAGVGRSALVSKMLTYFNAPLFVCEGKCTKDDKTPYSSIQKAFRPAWRRQVAVTPEDVKQVWRNKVSYTFDDAGLAALVALIPEFAEFISRDAKELAKHTPNISPEKFQSSIIALIHLSCIDMPLFLVQEDIQWADNMTLQFLARLLQVPELPPKLYVVATYRDNEVSSETHPFNTLFKNKVDSAKYSDIHLKGLDIKDVTDMLKDQFPTFSAQQIDQLAPSILDKSMGMPFFIQQLINSMSYDSAAASSSPSSHRLSQVFTTDALLEGKLVANLPNDLVSILTVASFLTTNFSSTVVARFLKKVSVTTAKDDVSFTVRGDNEPTPVTTKRATIETWLDDAVKRRILACTSKHNYEFLDDRVKETLFARVHDQGLKKTIHYHIGKVMLSLQRNAKVEVSMPELVEAARHVNVALDLITDTRDKRDAAKINLATAQNASAIADYETATVYARSARKLLPTFSEQTTKEELELLWEVVSVMQWAAFMSRDFDTALSAGKEQALIANTPLRKAIALRSKLTSVYLSLGDLMEAVGAAFDAWALLGLKQDTLTPQQLVVKPELVDGLAEEVKKLMNGDPMFLKKRELPAKLPALTEELTFASELCILSFDAIANTGVNSLIGYSVLNWLKLLILHPEIPVPSDVFFYYGLWVANNGDFDLAHQLWDYSNELINVNVDSRFRSHSFMHLLTVYYPRIYSWKKVKKFLSKAETIATSEGDAFAGQMVNTFKNVSGLYTEPIDTVLAGVNAFFHQIPKNAPFREFYRLLLNFFHGVKGDGIVEGDSKVQQYDQPILRFASALVQTEHLVFHANYDEAFAVVKAGWSSGQQSLRPGDFTTQLFNICSLIAVFWHFRTEKDPAVRQEMKARSEKGLQLLRGFDMGSQNTLPFFTFLQTEYDLAEALYRQSTEDDNDTLDEITTYKFLNRYGEVAKTADKNKHMNSGVYQWVVGLANERCAELCQAKGFDSMEIFFVGEAIRFYDTWGAKSLVTRVNKAHYRRSDSLSAMRSLSGSSTNVLTSGTSNASLLLTSSSPSLSHTSRANLMDSENSSAHIQYAKTISRGLVNHYSRVLQGQEGQRSVPAPPVQTLFGAPQAAAIVPPPSNRPKNTEAQSFENVLSIFQHYMATQVSDDMSTAEDSSHDDSSNDTSDEGTESTSSSTHSSLTSSAPTRFGEVVESSVDCASNYLNKSSTAINSQSSLPSVMVYIPQSCPSFVLNGAHLQELLTHVLLTFSTYTRNHLAVVVFCEKTNSRQFQIRFQITAHIPETVDTALPMPNATTLPANMISNLKYTEHLMESFHGETSYSHDNKQNQSILSLTVSVVAAPTVGLYFKTRVTQEIVSKYLHSWGVDYSVMTAPELATDTSSLKLLLMDAFPGSLKDWRSKHPKCQTAFIGAKETLDSQQQHMALKQSLFIPDSFISLTSLQTELKRLLAAQTRDLD